jgi:hypothetical protein
MRSSLLLDYQQQEAMWCLSENPESEQREKERETELRMLDNDLLSLPSGQLRH